MLTVLLACLFASSVYEQMNDYPKLHEATESVTFYAGRTAWPDFQKNTLLPFIKFLEDRNIYRGMVVTGYMFRRLGKMKIEQDTDNIQVLESLISELEHEREDRNPEGNPDSWTNEDTAVLESYRDLLKLKTLTRKEQ